MIAPRLWCCYTHAREALHLQIRCRCCRPGRCGAPPHSSRRQTQQQPWRRRRQARPRRQRQRQQQQAPQAWRRQGRQGRQRQHGSSCGWGRSPQAGLALPYHQTAVSTVSSSSSDGSIGSSRRSFAGRKLLGPAELAAAQAAADADVPLPTDMVQYYATLLTTAQAW